MFKLIYFGLASRLKSIGCPSWHIEVDSLYGDVFAQLDRIWITQHWFQALISIGDFMVLLLQTFDLIVKVRVFILSFHHIFSDF